MPSLLHIPLKKSQNVDLIKPLSAYIKNTFSEEKLNDSKDALAELNQLRSNAVVKSLDKHETSLEVLQRYYDQLNSMEAKLPIAEDQIRVTFTWLDAFDKGGLFGVAKASLISGPYEKCCTLFNIGALLSQIACSQNFSSDDGLKTAAKYFQQASGIYAHLKDTVYPQINTLPTPDLSVDCLGALSAMMLAQAQDCFYQKASADKMKDAIVARVAAQAADFYQDANRLACYANVKSMWEKDVLPMLSAKKAYFTSAAEYHQAAVCKEKGKYGEEVARLQIAEKCISDAIRYGDKYMDVREFADKVRRGLTAAKKDNDFIYLDRIPSSESLEAVGRASLAKSTPFQSPLSSSFVDLFSSLVPLAVHQAIATYDSKKADLVSREIGRLRESTQLLNGTLASLNLPAAIEDLSGTKVPQSVLDKSKDIKAKGGLEPLDRMMQDLPELLTRNREIIDEAMRMMNEEENEDTLMRDRFTDKWNRTPSRKLTEQLRVEGGKYKSILDNAVKADSIVKSKYNENRKALDILCKSEGEIEAALPKAGVSTGSQAEGPVQELRKLMNEVDEIKKDRDALEEQLKSSTFDMASKFLQALVSEGFIDAEKISNQSLEDAYGSFQMEVEESVTKQEALLSKIQDANNRFINAKNSSGAGDQREKMLKEFAQAYDAYIELVANLKEGTKFYNDLTNILLKFQNKVSDLVFARKTEKEDLSKDIQSALAKSAPDRTPTVPAHIQAQQRTPPERPAPPSTSAVPRPHQPTVEQPMPPYSNFPPANAPSGYYPTQSYMPQPGVYAPPGGIAGYSGGGYVPQPSFNPYQGYMQQPQGHPQYGQQPPVGYTGYPYNQPEQR